MKRWSAVENFRSNQKRTCVLSRIQLVVNKLQDRREPFFFLSKDRAGVRSSHGVQDIFQTKGQLQVKPCQPRHRRKKRNANYTRQTRGESTKLADWSNVHKTGDDVGRRAAEGTSQRCVTSSTLRPLGDRSRRRMRGTTQMPQHDWVWTPQ